MISRATVSNVPAYPKKLPTVLIATLATLVLCSGLVLTRELLASPSVGAANAPLRRRQFGQRTGAGSGCGRKRWRRRRCRGRRRAGRAFAFRGSARRAASAAVDAGGGAPVGLPVSAIEEFAHNLHQVGVAGSQMAFFAAAPDLDAGGVAVRFARALVQTGQQDTRVVLVALGADDAAIREISSDPSAPGLAELIAGTASFGDIITKDRASGLNLIAAGASRGALLAAPGMSRNFAALAHAYPHLVIDAGVLGGPDMAAIARVAPHAVLLVETLSGLTAARARDALIAAGFDNVTLLVAGRGEATAPIPAAAA